MKKIVRGVQVIRNNWKKSAFAATIVSLGFNYGKKSYDTRQLMRRYCEEAVKYGEEPQPLSKAPRRITVILNPAAKKKKSKDLYEKYCAPLLHLAGVLVTVVQTEYEGQAKDLPEALDPKTDAIVIAGGDGTLSETVTGLLRRAEGNLKALSSLPIAVLPLGRTNELASVLYGDEEEVKSMADATMAVIDGTLRKIDVIKIEPLQEEGRPIYSVGRVEWGVHRDVRAKRDKFWLFGPWREHVAYLFNGTPQPGQWTCQYCEPCEGCSNCYVPENTPKRWWSGFTPKTQTAPHLLIPNENCGIMQEKKISAVRWSLTTDTVASQKFTGQQHAKSVTQGPKINLEIGPSELGMTDLISEGWSKLNGGKPALEESVSARYLELLPSQQEKECWLSIDSENFEGKPIALTLMPKTLTVFTPRQDRIV